MTEAPTDLPPTGEAPVPAPRSPWGAFWRAHRLLLTLVGLAIVALLALDAWIVVKRRRYEAEIERLRFSMTDLERQRTDEIVAREKNKLRLAIALIRRQASLEDALHLSVALDSGAMFLEREGALLREMPVQVGPERTVGVPPDTVRLAAPRGVRTIARVLTDTNSWEIPAWVFADRGIEAPENRTIVGALGPALILDGGAIIYALPATGPLADSTYVLPGAVRARGEDLRAILPNLGAGMRVYLY